jgi:trans-2,3-dihydro-3-hydroxyanthranilate isomerase
VRVPFRLVDVFTDVPFAGNQLCVVPESPVGLDARSMQVLAREIAFSETTFVTAVRADGYDVRIFTPVSELPFAGHPTLGTAFTLSSEGRTGSRVVQRCEAGDIRVEVDLETGRARMHQLPPVFSEVFADRAAVAAAAGLDVGDLIGELPLVPVSTGISHLMVPVRNEEALRRAVRDDRGCAHVCEGAHAESLYLFAIRGDREVVARMFDQSASIGEDPATGSAAGPLGAYLSEHHLAGMPGSCTIAQGEQTGRPSFLEVDVAADGDTWLIEVGGGVRIVGAGAFEL